MDLFNPLDRRLGESLRRTRRHFLSGDLPSLGAVALAALSADVAQGSDAPPTSDGDIKISLDNPHAPRRPMFPAKAKRVIYLHLSGGPPQQDLYDWKPRLVADHMKPCPDEFLKKERFAFIKGHPKLLGTPYKFKQHGKSGAWFSELLPKLAEQADKLSFLKACHTQEINHAPAELFLFTGSPRPDGASVGSWITYGLGSENADLPGYVVLVSGGTDPTGGKSLWSAGFLPSVFQGVQCRSSGEPVLFVNDPAGMSREIRRDSLDTLRELNKLEYGRTGDPETLTRINQYELAFRMQMSVPETTDLSKENKATLELYGAEPGKGSFANNCLMARRMIEKGVRFVQLFDWGWDIHGTRAGDDIINQLPKKCREVDRPIAALLIDLERRGLLESTLVVCGGEFGRTSMNEARGGSTFLGRDHHPHCFTLWLAGAGIKTGINFGATDEFGYLPIEGKTSVRDVQATILHLLGLDAWKLSYSYQGLRNRLIGPAGEGRIIKEILS